MAKSAKKVAAVSLASATKKVDPHRYPCGQLRPMMSPAKIKRVLNEASIRAENRFLGEPLGWLKLQNILTHEQICAGMHYGAMRGRYDRIKGLPRRSARSTSYEQGYGGWAEDLPDDDDDLKFSHYFETEFRTKITAISYPTTGVRILSLMDLVCVELQVPSYPQYEELKAGLNKVCEEFRIRKE